MDVTRGFSYCAFPDKHDLSNFTYKFINHEQMEAVYKGVQNERNKIHEKQIWNNFCEDRNQDIEDIYDDEEVHPDPDCQQYMLDKIQTILMSTLTQGNLLTEEDSDVGGFPSQTPDVCLNVTTLEENTDGEVDPKLLENKDWPTDFLPSSKITRDVVKFEQEEVRQENEKQMALGDISKNLIDESLKRVTNFNPCRSSENVALKKKNKGTVFSEKNYIGNSSRLQKVKAAWTKLHDILKEILNYLEIHNSQALEQNHLLMLEKRAQEFCSRFVRMHEYQLKIQMSDFKRSLNVSLSFAQHLHFQMLVKKIISLLNNLYKAFEMFHSLLPDIWDNCQVKLHLNRLVQMIFDFSNSCSVVPLMHSIHGNLIKIPSVLQVANCILEITKDYNESAKTSNTDIAASCMRGCKHSGRVRSASSVKSNKNQAKVSSRLSMYSLHTNTKSGSSTKLPVRTITARLDTKNKLMNAKFNRVEDCQIDLAAKPSQPQATGGQKPGRPLMNGQPWCKFTRQKALPDDDILTVVQMMGSSPESTSRRFSYKEVSDEVPTSKRTLDKKKDPAGECELPYRLSGDCAGECAGARGGALAAPPADGLERDAPVDKNDHVNDKMPELTADKYKDNIKKDPKIKMYVNKNTEATIFRYHSTFLRAVNKRHVPWSMVGRLSDDFLDEIIMIIAKDMLLDQVLKNLYKMELI